MKTIFFGLMVLNSTVVFAEINCTGTMTTQIEAKVINSDVSFQLKNINEDSLELELVKNNFIRLKRQVFANNQNIGGKNFAANLDEYGSRVSIVGFLDRIDTLGRTTVSYTRTFYTSDYSQNRIDFMKATCTNP